MIVVFVTMLRFKRSGFGDVVWVAQHKGVIVMCCQKRDHPCLAVFYNFYSCKDWEIIVRECSVYLGKE